MITAEQDKLFLISIKNFVNEKLEHRSWLIKLMTDRMPEIPADIDSWVAGRNFPQIQIRLRITGAIWNHNCNCKCK